MTFRGVLHESFNAYKHEWWTLVPAGFLIYFFVALFGLVVESLWTAGAFLAVAATFMGQLGLTALHVVEANNARAGKPPTRMSETLKSMRGRLKVLLGVYVVGVVGLGIFTALLILLPRVGTAGGVIGLLVFIAGVAFLLTRLSMLAPVVMLEDVGVLRAFRRSNALVRGHSWRVFRILLTTEICGAFIGGCVGFLFGIVMLRLDTTLVRFVIEVVVEGIMASLIVLVLANIYFNLLQLPERAPETVPVAA